MSPKPVPIKIDNSDLNDSPGTPQTKAGDYHEQYTAKHLLPHYNKNGAPSNMSIRDEQHSQIKPFIKPSLRSKSSTRNDLSVPFPPVQLKYVKNTNGKNNHKRNLSNGNYASKASTTLQS